MNEAKEVICPCCHAQLNPNMQVGLTAKALSIYAAAPDLLEACEAALPWIGKMIADGAHMNSVAPNACVGAMQRLEAAIRKAKPEGK